MRPGHLAPMLLFALAACQTTRPLPVLVRDAETRAPIAGAEVQLWYPLRRDLTARTGTTEADGTVRLSAVCDEDAGAIVEARAPGYLLSEHSVPLETVQALKAPANREAPARVVVDLLAEPPPYVELVVPVGYRGKVTVDVHIRDDTAAITGPRCFTALVSPQGAAQVEGPPLLRLVTPADYRAKYADGTPIRAGADSWAVGLHWLRAEGDGQVFVVDTQRDFDAIRADSAPPRPRPSQGGQGGGRGGRHRRGGQASS